MDVQSTDVGDGRETFIRDAGELNSKTRLMHFVFMDVFNLHPFILRPTDDDEDEEDDVSWLRWRESCVS